MIYLIGGPPRCGKSTLAQRLCRELAVPWISTDPLVQVLGAFDPALRDVEEDKFTEYASKVWPHIRTFIIHAATCIPYLTIEGDTFLPEQAASLAAELKIRSCFLGLSRTSVDELTAQIGHNDWLLRVDGEIRDRMPQWIQDRSSLISEQCKALSIPFVDLSADWTGGMQRAFALLTENRPQLRARSGQI